MSTENTAPVIAVDLKLPDNLPAGNYIATPMPVYATNLILRDSANEYKEYLTNKMVSDPQVAVLELLDKLAQNQSLNNISELPTELPIYLYRTTASADTLGITNLSPEIKDTMYKEVSAEESEYGVPYTEVDLAEVKALNVPKMQRVLVIPDVTNCIKIEEEVEETESSE